MSEGGDSGITVGKQPPFEATMTCPNCKQTVSKDAPWKPFQCKNCSWNSDIWGEG